MDGEELPKNIFFAGAINPRSTETPRTTLNFACRRKSVGGVEERKICDDASVAVDMPSARGFFDHTGVRGTATIDMSDFVVREMPLALQVRVIL